MARRRRRSSACSDESKEYSQSKPLLENCLTVKYAKRKKPESLTSIVVQIGIIVVFVSISLYTYFYFDHFHFHLTHYFASKLDDHHAQHVMGHKLLKNLSDTRNDAFDWFRKSADKGHPHSAYNLAAGHLSGFKTDVKKGEVRQLLKFAAKNGVEEAKHLLRTLCKDKPKYCDL